jgi:tetraacyldisaccharide 4'-kinase
MPRAPAFWWTDPGLTARMLAPAAALYGGIAAARLKRPGYRAPVPVICVGDPTLGGGGKTPAVIAFAELLRAAGESPYILSRGYGGAPRGPLLVDPARMDARETGDEPLLLAAAAPTVVARDRVSAAKLALEQRPSVLLLDDGFQNPSLEKDLSLLVLDGEGGIGNARVFPAGPLRAPLAAQLEHAQGVIRIGAGRAGEEVATKAEKLGLAVLTARIVPDPAVASGLAGKRILAFAGIARPDKFFTTLRDIGAELVERRAFSDHYRFSAADAQALLAAARMNNLRLATTEKDRTRMRGDPTLAELASAAITLPVRLEFQDLVAVRKLVAGALAAARDRSSPAL